MQPTIKQRIERIVERTIFHNDKVDQLERLKARKFVTADRVQEKIAHHWQKIEWLKAKRQELEKEQITQEQDVNEYRLRSIARNNPNGYWDGEVFHPPGMALRTGQAAEERGQIIDAASASRPPAQGPGAASTLPPWKREMQVHRAQMAFLNDKPNLLPEPDPFYYRYGRPTATRTEQDAHLERLIADPSPFVIFPFTKSYLEATEWNSTDDLRIDAKMAMETFFDIKVPLKELDEEMRDIHEEIANCPGLSDQAKTIFLITTFVPPGRVVSYRSIRDWLSEARGMTPDYQVISALKKCSLRMEDVPVHRVIERSGGIGGVSCRYGSHMPDVDEDEWREILELEGCKFDRTGRLQGGVMHIHEIEDLMKGSAVIRFIREFPRRGDRRVMRLG